jgi:hypothetical protein
VQVRLELLRVGQQYSRGELAQLWGCAGPSALNRGVVTPHGDRNIILFVTRLKRGADYPYQNELREGRLYWEGPRDHFAEQRILDAETAGEQLLVFYLEHHRHRFTYLGPVRLVSAELHQEYPSRFVFRVQEVE